MYFLSISGFFGLSKDFFGGAEANYNGKMYEGFAPSLPPGSYAPDDGLDKNQIRAIKEVIDYLLMDYSSNLSGKLLV